MLQDPIRIVSYRCIDVDVDVDIQGALVGCLRKRGGRKYWLVNIDSIRRIPRVFQSDHR